ncbi:MAG: BamA/TamA family outer membrane protein, partial [Acidobacteriota bacterium]
AKPVQPSLLEKTLLKVENGGCQNLTRYKNFYAKFNSVTTGSGIAPGVRYWKPRLLGSELTFQASGAYSFKKYQLYDLQFGKVYPKGRDFLVRPSSGSGASFLSGETARKTRPDFFLYADLRYRDFPDEDFFGSGPHSRKDDQTDFSLTDISYDAVLGYQFNSWFTALARVGYLLVDIDPGEDSRYPDTQDLFNDDSAPGLSHQPDFLHVNAGLLMDFRDRPGNPHRGGSFAFSAARFDDRGGNGQFEFNRFSVDGRYYLALGSEQRVLAFRFFTSLDDENGESRVPFYLQETLGGDTALRGFRNFRFRGTHLLYLSAEYRWEASPALEFAIFYDRGKVFADHADWDFTGLEKGFGLGVRAKTLQSVLLRVDFARSREDTFRVSFKFSRSF